MDETSCWAGSSYWEQAKAGSVFGSKTGAFIIIISLLTFLKMLDTILLKGTRPDHTRLEASASSFVPSDLGFSLLVVCDCATDRVSLSSEISP